MADQPNTYMNISKKISGGLATLFLVAGLMGATNVSAATSPSLGAADTYSVLSGAGATNGGAGSTTISGNLGVHPAASYTDGGTTVFLTPGNPHLADVSAQNAQIAQKAVFDGPLDFVQQPCTVNYTANTELSTAGALNPGVYCTDAGHDFTLSGTLTLNGTGSPATDVWIFRSARDVIGSGTANVVFTGTGGLACNVWWRVANTGTFTADNAMVGNILAATSITFGQGATLNGRAFAYTGAVTMLGNTISGPTCSSPAPAATPASRASYNTLTVFKQVINDNGGTALFSDFPLFIGTNSTKSGESVRLIPGLYTVSETSRPNYTTTFVGDCNANGVVNHGGINTHNDICTIVNDDIGTPVAPIPPLIHITKIPNPLALPAGPGLVTYDFAVSNVGIAPMTNVTVTDQRCGAVTFLSGDTDLDARLDVGEVWNYQCAMTLNQTTENTVTATGQANGLTATDIAVSTVVVGSPLTPPLIDLTKVPTPLFLPAGGGLVKYNYIMNNPGVVALSNVSLTDDRCTQLIGPFGDTDADNLLDIDEAWNYTCQMQLNATTTNTATAEGSANGFTVRHISVVTVAVAAPGLPNTGFGPLGNPRVLMVIGEALVAIALLFVVTQRKRLFS